MELSLFKGIRAPLRQLVSYPIDSWRVKKFRRDIQFLSNELVCSRLRDEGYSLARFGDGELRWMLGDNSVPSFQDGSPALSAALLQAFNVESSRLLIALPRAIISDGDLCFKARAFWRHTVASMGSELFNLIDDKRSYADCNLTRPYLDFKDKSRCGERFKLIESIWRKRDVLIVEGAGTRFGVGNGLLDRCRTVRRILCPCTNAFESIDQIRTAVVQNVKSGDLVLLCLGPTASVLAVEFSQLGIQAIDIGHLDVEYEWMQQGARDKQPVPGRSVNEAGTGGYVDDSYSTDEYERQIVAKIEGH